MTFVDFSEYNIGFKGKYVIINRLESHSEVGTIIHHLNRHFNNPQTKHLSLRFFPSTNLFANLIVPLASIFHSFKEIGKVVTLHTESKHIQEMCILDPPLASNQNFESSTRILDKIWKVENEFHLNNVVFYYRRFLGAKLGFDTPALNALQLAIIESIENALIHSENNCCFVMAQLHIKKDYFSICVSDMGIGVQKSLEDGGCKFESEPEYLAASIKKGVTSKHMANYGGNGLYCLSRLAKINAGQFCLWSGESSIVVDGKSDSDRIYESLPRLKFFKAGNHVDFQIPLSRSISADYDELDFSSEEQGEEYNPYEGFNRIIISELECGYCTRSAGDRAYTTVRKYLEFPTTIGVVIDFVGIPICSTSFLASFIGILFRAIGENEFNDRIRIDNATYEIRKTIYAVTKKIKR